MNTIAIIPAAGLGKRFGGPIAKQFLELDKKPVLIHTLLTFEKCTSVDAICIATPSAEIDRIQEIVRQHNLKKVRWVVPGGKERQDSVRLGFESIPKCEIIIVHDGVRPFVTPDLIEKSIMEAREHGGCVVGMPVKETTKKIDAENFVSETIDRSTLWSIQTPQTFRYELFAKAVAAAVKSQFLGTDEAMLVERIGGRVKVILGSPHNLKITTPEDLQIAETILKMRNSL